MVVKHPCRTVEAFSPFLSFFFYFFFFWCVLFAKCYQTGSGVQPESDLSFTIASNQKEKQIKIKTRALVVQKKSQERLWAT